MWGSPDPDPGGSRDETSKLSPQELSDLKDQNEQQLVLIAQLKEMLRKEQSSVSQEKVEEYVNTLNRNKAKRSSRQKKDGSGPGLSGSSSSVGIDASKKERINLLRQQMEENKAKLAERGKSQKGIEEMVTQIQAQFKDNQTLNSSTSLNVSLIETKNLDYNENTPQKDLYNILLTKEKKITELLNKSQKLEGTILDLQENLKEKDSVIDARTKAITLMTESFSKKGKSTLDTLEETKDQMRKMQENFVTLEAEMKARQLTLLNDLKLKNFEISDLQQANHLLEKEKSELEKTILEFERSRISVLNSEDEDFHQLKHELKNLKDENEINLAKINHFDSIVSENNDLKKKLEDINKQNDENLSKLEEVTYQLKTHQEKLESNSSHSYLESLNGEKRKLEDENDLLLRNNSENLMKIADLEKQLKDALTDLQVLKITGLERDENKLALAEKDEIVKLKKQLDESNKNMIKMRATQKGKIKELNKKLDQFKKMSDSNALIVQLQNEISKLNEKIAELEDEKGNLQLKMVESTSSSKEESTEIEVQIKEFEEKLFKSTSEIEEKSKIIDILESEVLSLKAELQQKSEEEVIVTKHVSSEMSSINYEEQIEKIESEKQRLIEELETIRVEKKDLLEEIENLKKDKQEIALKLENYIQENMDLIDKLEKLSAEKVSSAESIEIVEGLTQQEKLELAAYQKQINPEESIKYSEEDNIEPPAELNESVLQLSEDTVELLQKIEMFTQERKEVMQRMEALKEENNVLSLKVKEIENNKDILEETYEQLQNEKEVLSNEKLELIKQLEVSHQSHVKDQVDDQSAYILEEKLTELQNKCEALVLENNDLKHTIKELDSKIQEKYDLESRLQELIENNTFLETKLSSNLDEINTYKISFEENKNELIRSSELISELTEKLKEREKDIEELNSNIDDLNNVITELQHKNNNYEHMESELHNLKLSLNEQISQANEYESEMADNNESMQKLQAELVHMNKTIAVLENELELKDNEIQKLTKDINNKDEIIKTLQSEIEEKDAKFKTVSEDIKEKYLSLQKQLDSNEDSLKQQIDDLSTKNKEQLEKMKKIAANLKKKTQAYQQLEDQYKNDKEKWESEATEKNKTIQNSQEKITSLETQVQKLEYQLKLAAENKIAIENEILNLKHEAEILEQNNADQQYLIQELKHTQAKHQEVSLQKEMSDSLHEEIDESFTRIVPEDKIRELEMMLETNESELNHYKERVTKSEEIIRNLLEEKSALELKIVELIEKLDLTSNSFKEKALLEDQLELKLAEVSANDEALSKKLQEIQKEQEELSKKNHDYEELIKKLKVKLKKAHDKVTELKTSQTTLQELELENRELKNQLSILETNHRHIQNENESLQRRNLSDYEKIEADYQIQLEELLKTKNDLIVENEKLSEQLKELTDREQELNMELDEYKLRLDQRERSHIEEINQLKEEVRNNKGDLEKTLNENQRLDTELKGTQERFQQALIEFDDLSQELKNTEDQLVDISELQKHLFLYTSENNELKIKLKDTNVKLEQVLLESNGLQEQLTILNEKLQISFQENTELNKDIEKLKGEIETLKSVTASSNNFNLESNSDDFFCKNINQTQSAIPTFQWPEQQHADVDIFDNLNKEISLAEGDNAVKYGNLQTEVEDLKQQLKNALQESDQLKKECEDLKSEILALQFAKASLEASCESSQKFTDLNWEVSETQVLEQFRPENIKQSQKIQLDSKLVDPEPVPIFDSIVPKENEKIGVDPFDIGSDNQSKSFSPVIEDSREALLKKIKALEFLLYNMDKEKEIALEQCMELVNELTEVLYAQSNLTGKGDKSLSDLESQIMSVQDIDKISMNKKDLQKTEYTSFNREFGEQQIPVKEQIIESRKSYLCFDNESLDSQIMSGKDIADTENKSELHKLEFETVDRSLGEQSQPVIEPVLQSKNAYMCYAKEEKPQSFEENDDGWGWGPEEARLEEEHISSLENIPQVKNFLLEIQQLRENIKVLQVERENHLEEIKQLQIKSGKLIKKYKELKSKSNQEPTSKKQNDGGFFDLNETIQEELKAQIQQLEKKIKEVAADLEKERQEKNNLLKKVDVLTSANEKMIEMKEIQDSEVFMWQRKHKEAVEKLQEYEWSSDGFGELDRKSCHKTQPSASDNDTRIQELENTIRELSLDNEELQTLLEEQTARRIEAERNKSIGNDQEVLELRLMNKNLHEELDEIKIKTNEFKNELNIIQKEKNKLNEEKSTLEKKVVEKDVQIQSLEDNLKRAGEVNSQDHIINDLQKQINTLNNQLSDKQIIINELENNLALLNERKIELEQNVIQLKNELSSKENLLSSNIENSCKIEQENCFLKAQIDQLNTIVDEKDKAFIELNDVLNKLESEKRENKEILEHSKSKLLEYEGLLTSITEEKDKKDLECQQLLEDVRAKTAENEEYQRMIVSLQEHVKEIEVFGSENNSKEHENQVLVEELQSKSLEIYEKERLIQDLRLKIDESNQFISEKQLLSDELALRNKDLETLSAEKAAKEKEIQQLLINFEDKDKEFEALVNEMNENWQAQVDQRGVDVAESWKIHLEMVEKDYNAEIEKMKADLTELEEKCNMLSNENNELRKNVDHEIMTEVDKLSALQQQISVHLQTIDTLNMKLEEKDKQIEEIQNNLSNYISLEQELQTAKQDIIEKENKLASMNIIIDTTQKQFDEKREVVESIISILEKNSPSPISYEKELILNEFQRQLGTSSDRDHEIIRLNQNVVELEEKIKRISGESQREITGLNQIIEDLERELGVVHEKEAEIVRLTTELNNIVSEKQSLEQEIDKIKQDRDSLLPEYEKIKNEHMNCEKIVEEYKYKIEDYLNTNQTLQHILDERNRELNDLNQKLMTLQEVARRDSNREVEKLNSIISKAKDEYLALQETLNDCQRESEETRRELAQKSGNLDIVTQNLHSYQKYYTDFEEEIRRLKKVLEDCQTEYKTKDLERQTLLNQIDGLTRQNYDLNERLNERTKLVDEDTKQLEELRQIIEEQVMKIEELKKELFDKSNQYDSLIAEMDVGRQPVTQQPVASTSLTPLDMAQKQKYTEEDLTQPVSRAELDLALYMLHQRDVRCEELTVELTQLLEERDTLQLRLSNAIREKEELRKTLVDSSPEPSVSSDRENASARSKSSAIFLAASGTELAKDPLENEQSLATKLSELKIVGYKKDKTFVDEQEARRFQQLAIMQQHINEASKLPAEAAARLVDASYTLSRDVQSPSKVLLNWLWGKNPPKANDS